MFPQRWSRLWGDWPEIESFALGIKVEDKADPNSFFYEEMLKKRRSGQCFRFLYKLPTQLFTFNP